MFEARSRIAEHIVHFQTDSMETMDWLRQTFEIDDGKGSRQGQNFDLTVTIRGGYGQPFENFEVDIATSDGWVIYDRADYKLKIDAEHQNAIIDVYDYFALKHALMNLYSSFIVHNKWGLLIHSSCVVVEGGAYIFSGRSGAGKSTIARLSFPRQLLSDEATIVKVTGDDVIVYESPFRSDTRPGFHQGGIPLRAIHLIHQSHDVKRERKQPTQGLVQLMDKVFYWAYDKEQTKTILRMYERLAARVPIFDLYFQKNDTFWEAIS